MKFLLPGHVIQLLKPATLATTIAAKEGSCQFRQVAETGLTEFPKGTKLRVSQMYIRKIGYYENSITFKVLSPELLKLLLAARIAKSVSAWQMQADFANKMIGLANPYDTAICLKVKWEDARTAKWQNDILEVTHFKTDETDETKLYHTVQRWAENHQIFKWPSYQSIVGMNVSELTQERKKPEFDYLAIHIYQQRKMLKEMEANIKAVQDPKSAICKRFERQLKASCIRIKLTDIESWDIKILELDEKAAAKPF